MCSHWQITDTLVVEGIYEMVQLNGYQKYHIDIFCRNRDRKQDKKVLDQQSIGA